MKNYMQLILFIRMIKHCSCFDEFVYLIDVSSDVLCVKDYDIFLMRCEEYFHEWFYQLT